METQLTPTMNTDLSPAAQALMDAYYSTDSLRSAPALAAVLRAVVKHLSDQLPFEDSSRIDVVDLLAIASELEGDE